MKKVKQISHSDQKAKCETFRAKKCENAKDAKREIAK